MIEIMPRTQWKIGMCQIVFGCTTLVKCIKTDLNVHKTSSQVVRFGHDRKNSVNRSEIDGKYNIKLF